MYVVKPYKVSFYILYIRTPGDRRYLFPLTEIRIASVSCIRRLEWERTVYGNASKGEPIIHPFVYKIGKNIGNLHYLTFERPSCINQNLL